MTIIQLSEVRARRQAQAPPRVVDAPPWRPRLVVVADDAEWRSAFRLFLWDQPYDTELIAAPFDWAAIAELNPDVVVLDLDQQRRRLLRHAYSLKRSVLGRFVPVIGIGGECTHESRLRAFASGVDQWLSKPMTCEEMRLAVLTALRARQNYRALLERV